MRERWGWRYGLRGWRHLLRKGYSAPSDDLTKVPYTTPVIDGTGLSVPANDAALILVKNLSHVTVSGFEIRNFRTAVSSLVPAGILVEGNGTDIRIHHNVIHHIENNGPDPASINAFGLAVYGNSATGPISNLFISGNLIRNTKTGSSETLTLNGNVTDFQVTGNVIHDVNNIGIDCIGFENTSPIAGQDQARNGLISGNLVYNVSSRTNPAYYGDRSANGIYVDGGMNIVIEQNTVHNADIGMEMTSEHGGRFASFVTVRNNQIYSCNIVGLSIGGYAATKGGTRDCTFTYNTFSKNDTISSGSGEFAIQYNTLRNTFQHNTVNASNQGVLISGVLGAGSVPGVASDYNMFAAPANPSWQWNGKAYSTLASYQAGSKQDLHSTFSLH
jgi:hypothetical protein